MKKINLRELYPDVYTTDFFVDVTEEVMETIRAAERAEAAYERKMYRYKAQYSLDCENGIENAVLLKPQTPEMLLEEKQFQEQVYAAVSGNGGKRNCRSRRCRPKPCPRQYPPWIKAACKIFLIKFHLMRLFFAFFVSVNKKDKFSSFISTLTIE